MGTAAGRVPDRRLQLEPPQRRLPAVVAMDDVRGRARRAAAPAAACVNAVCSKTKGWSCTRSARLPDRGRRPPTLASVATADRTTRVVVPATVVGPLDHEHESQECL